MPLTHLWFCAVTMQFYLVWPVILMALCGKTRSRNTAIGITIAFALVSTAAMVLMFNPTADTSRVYYGTDARAAELLCGALAAIAAPRLREMLSGDIHIPGANKGISKVNAFSIAWLVAVIAGALMLTGESAWLYRGGFLLFALATGLLIICVQNTECIVRRLLSVKPLVWLGQRSFSVYLVHYPLLLLMNPATRTTRIAWWEQALQLVLILAVAEVFYRLVERPWSHKPAQQDSTARKHVLAPAMVLPRLAPHASPHLPSRRLTGQASPPPAPSSAVPSLPRTRPRPRITEPTTRAPSLHPVKIPSPATPHPMTPPSKTQRGTYRRKGPQEP
ncbi:MAG: acyltransferase family protein [Collinsella sp.]